MIIGAAIIIDAVMIPATVMIMDAAMIMDAVVILQAAMLWCLWFRQRMDALLMHAEDCFPKSLDIMYNTEIFVHKRDNV